MGILNMALLCTLLTVAHAPAIYHTQTTGLCFATMAVAMTREVELRESKLRGVRDAAAVLAR